MEARGWYRTGNTHLEHQEYERAISCYDHALALDPSYENAWNNRGCCAAHLGHYDEAIRCFERCGERANLAAVLGMAERHDEATEVFLDLLQRSPAHLPARISAINLLTFQGRYEEALRCYREMPRPAALTSMLPGSPTDEVKALRAAEDRGEDLNEAVRTLREGRAAGTGEDLNERPKIVGLRYRGDDPR